MWVIKVYSLALLTFQTDHSLLASNFATFKSANVGLEVHGVIAGLGAGESILLNYTANTPGHPNGTFVFDTVTLEDGATLAMYGVPYVSTSPSYLYVDDLTIAHTSSLSVSGAVQFWIDGDFTLDRESTMRADGGGYAMGAGPSPGGAAYLSRGTGGAHGGRGGGNQVAVGASVMYDDMMHPTDFGSGGTYSSGGGAIFMNVSGTTARVPRLGWNCFCPYSELHVGDYRQRGLLTAATYATLVAPTNAQNATLVIDTLIVNQYAAITLSLQHMQRWWSTNSCQ